MMIKFDSDKKYISYHSKKTISDQKHPVNPLILDILIQKIYLLLDFLYNQNTKQ
jgi:hypothetical protein